MSAYSGRGSFLGVHSVSAVGARARALMPGPSAVGAARKRGGGRRAGGRPRGFDVHSNLLRIPRTKSNSGMRSTCRHPAQTLAYDMQACRLRSGELLPNVRAIAAEVGGAERFWRSGFRTPSTRRGRSATRRRCELTSRSGCALWNDECPEGGVTDPRLRYGLHEEEDARSSRGGRYRTGERFPGRERLRGAETARRWVLRCQLTGVGQVMKRRRERRG